MYHACVWQTGSFPKKRQLETVQETSPLGLHLFWTERRNTPEEPLGPFQPEVLLLTDSGAKALVIIGSLAEGQGAPTRARSCTMQGRLALGNITELSVRGGSRALGEGAHQHLFSFCFLFLV